MKKATYRQIPSLLKNRKSFSGNSCHAEWVNDNYNVYSYTTLMLSVDENDMVLYWNDSYYSNTTSRLQNILRGIYTLN